MKTPRTARILSILLVLFLVTIACATLVPDGPDPTPAEGFEPTTAPALPGSRAIVYLGEDGNLYLVDADGGPPLALTSDAQPRPQRDGFRLYQNPTWSFDGSRMAYVAIESASNGTKARLLVADMERGDTSEVFFSERETPFYLYWSPDSQRVSFLSSAPASPHLFLRLAFLDGRDSIVLDTGQPYYWVWSPDSELIFVHEGGSNFSNPQARLSFLTPDGELDDPLPLPPYQFQAPAWSPDGQRLLAALEGESVGILTLLDGSGTPLQSLATFNAGLSFSWSPDGESIATRTGTLASDGFLGTLAVFAAGSPDEQQAAPENTVLAYFWAPDSRQLAYFYLEETGGGVDALISAPRQAEVRMALGVLDIGSGETRRLAVFRPSEDFLAILPFFDQYHHSATLWSPDSSRLVYSALDANGAPVIWVVAADGETPPERLAAGTLAFWSWR